ncbi:MAG: efflux RND transporter periplasmic adaptor subunit [Bacteroidales bacterium]|nr:MAG: efflux RND transporter periplasmic adaptor subunit [Bacteroidales bacterium]
MERNIILLFLTLTMACAPEQRNNEQTAAQPVSKVPVYVKTVRPESFEHFIQVSGSVEAEQDAMISPEINGQIRTIHVKEGEHVERGHLLVSLNTSITESTIDEVKTGLKLATKLYEKQKGLWDQNIGSEIQYLEAKNAKESTENRLKTLMAQLEMARIRAPFDGIIEEIYSKVGELASPGMMLLRIINLSDLNVKADVSEIYLSSLRTGDPVHLEFPSYPDIKLETPITRIGNVIHPQSRTFRIEMKLKNPDNQLKPNILTRVKVVDFSTDSALLVPSIIIKNDANGSYLYIAQQNSQIFTAQKMYVEKGPTYEDQTMIISGLESGQNVIVAGYDQVNNGIPVEIK